MKANEIRIGNLYDHFGEIKKVTPNTILEVWESKREWCKPITITEEWLLRARFIKSFAVTNFAIQTEDGVLDLVPSEIDGYHVYFDDNWICTIQYVHQLQNLYFALTNQELTINEDSI